MTAAGSAAVQSKEVFLLILESIGTSELLLIGVIALVFLGPRRLPQIAKTIGKYMAEFRQTTNEFKSTWEKEVDFAMEEENAKKQATEMAQEQVARLDSGSVIDSPALNEASLPEIKQIDGSAFAGMIPANGNALAEAETAETVETAEIEEAPRAPGKQDWL